MKKKNLIMSISKSYSYDKIRPFVETLKKTSFDGDFVLFACEMDKKTRKILSDHGVILIDFENTNREYQIHSPSKYIINKNNFNIPLMSYRFLLYKQYLSKNKNKYQRVFLTDLDVVFQKNPFDFNTDCSLCVFAEDGLITDSGTERWILNAYGKDYLQKVKKRKCFCAGTTIGSTKLIISYLNFIIRNMNCGNDQAIHNYLIHEREIPGLNKFDNGDVCLTASHKSLFKIKNKKVYNSLDKEVNFIHQWQKNDTLWSLFGRPRISQKIIIHLKKNEKLRKKIQIIKDAIYGVPLIGKTLRRIYINYK